MNAASSSPRSEGLTDPLPDLASWVEFFKSSEIPVLQTTADTLESLRANEDSTDANNIGELIFGDPLMTLKVFVHAANQRGARETATAETATAALVMMGISPFFTAFPAQPTVEARLSSVAGALAGLHKVLRRAHRSADFALAIAVHRNDPNAAAVYVAALLHEFTEMLLWIYAPRLALRIDAVQAAEPALQSQDAQQEVLAIPLSELQNELSVSWHLPTLLQPDDVRRPAAGSVGRKTVALSSHLACHTADGWFNPAVGTDIEQIATLLNVSEPAAMQLMQTVDGDLV